MDSSFMPYSSPIHPPLSSNIAPHSKSITQCLQMPTPPLSRSQSPTSTPANRFSNYPRSLHTPPPRSCLPLNLHFPSAIWNAYCRPLSPTPIYLSAASSSPSRSLTLTRRSTSPALPTTSTTSQRRQRKLRKCTFRPGRNPFTYKYTKDMEKSGITLSAPCLEPSCANCRRWYGFLLGQVSDSADKDKHVVVLKFLQEKTRSQFARIFQRDEMGERGSVVVLRFEEARTRREFGRIVKGGRRKVAVVKFLKEETRRGFERIVARAGRE